MPDNKPAATAYRHRNKASLRQQHLYQVQTLTLNLSTAVSLSRAAQHTCTSHPPSWEYLYAACSARADSAWAAAQAYAIQHNLDFAGLSAASEADSFPST